MFARRDPDLIPVLRDRFSFDLEIRLAMHDDLRMNRRMCGVFAHLDIALSSYVRSGHKNRQEAPHRVE
jgi:hypothetical protein